MNVQKSKKNHLISLLTHLTVLKSAQSCFTGILHSTVPLLICYPGVFQIHSKDGSLKEKQAYSYVQKIHNHNCMCITLVSHLMLVKYNV